MNTKLDKRNIIIIIISILLITLGIWIYLTNTNITTTKLTIKNEKIPKDFNNYKIVEIADLHNKDWKDKLISKIEKEKPNIITITGDFIDSEHTNFEIALEFINKAKYIAPIYYVTGNHEAWIDNYEELKKLLIEAGVHVLENESIFLNKNNSNINLVGLQDPDFIEKTNIKGVQDDIINKKLWSLLDSECYNIVLCHRPELFETYVSLNVDLALTGHVHGGQIRIPFVGGLIAPNQGFFPKYAEGIYHKNNTDMVVSRGLGNSILPIRINNMPELVVIELQNK